MDPKDFNFTIKSGRDIQTEPNSNLDNTQLDDIMAIILTFAENAIESADVYCRHANRRVIIDKDIKMAMQWEVFMYLQRDNSKKLTKNLEKISNFKNDEEQQLDSNLDILSESNENVVFDIPTRSICFFFFIFVIIEAYYDFFFFLLEGGEYQKQERKRAGV